MKVKKLIVIYSNFTINKYINMNTVLLVEPRKIWYIYDLLKQYQDVLENMYYVFFLWN